MTCERCGTSLPAAANFCAACGTPVAATGQPSEATTASIDAGELDPVHDLPALPTLAAGTGMLVVVRGPNAGSRYLLDRLVTIVGRHPDAEIFLDDVTVSRRHAEFVHDQDGRIAVRDLGSLNGSYVNGERVEERSLATGDEVQIGRFKLLYVGSPSGVGSG